NVPWLARTHAVTMVPSITALLTLRKLPLGTASRQELIGFGDPVFSKEQQKEAETIENPMQTADASNVTRGMPLKRRSSPKLDGLTQPALALSAPAVADVDGDGLLTMEEILSLRLDADWVVLSACNTGAGVVAGAEAASGLGRAFFYAGTRALLVTNWSVHSQSARDLTTDLFRLQNADQTLSRGEALRQAMMALMDGRGFVGADGKTIFAYAHPLFW